MRRLALQLLFIFGVCVSLPLGARASLLLLTNEQIRDASHAAGFCFGQDYTLGEIERLHPALTAQVLLVRRSFESRFPGACAELERRLLEISEKAWAKEKARSLDLLKKAIEIGSEYDAVVALAEIQVRTEEGQIPSPILELLLAASSPNRRDPSWEMRQGWKQKFIATGHPKARGLELIIEAPRSWKQEEAKRPHVVQKWMSQNGRGSDAITLLVKRADGGRSKCPWKRPSLPTWWTPRDCVEI